MFPLSFKEFLQAIGDSILVKELEQVTVEKPFSMAIHSHTLTKVRDYFQIGGMPQAILASVQTNSPIEWKKVQQMILVLCHA